MEQYQQFNNLKNSKINEPELKTINLLGKTLTDTIMIKNGKNLLASNIKKNTKKDNIDKYAYNKIEGKKVSTIISYNVINNPDKVFIYDRQKNLFNNYLEFKNKKLESQPKKCKSIEKNGRLIYNIDMNSETQYSFKEPIQQKKNIDNLSLEKIYTNQSSQMYNIKPIHENENNNKEKISNTKESNPYKIQEIEIKSNSPKIIIKSNSNNQEINQNQILKESQTEQKNSLLLKTVTSIPLNNNSNNSNNSYNTQILSHISNSFYKVNSKINLGETTKSIYQNNNSQNNNIIKKTQNIKFELNNKSSNPNNSIIIKKIKSIEMPNNEIINNSENIKINSDLNSIKRNISLPSPKINILSNSYKIRSSNQIPELVSINQNAYINNN